MRNTPPLSALVTLVGTSSRIRAAMQTQAVADLLRKRTTLSARRSIDDTVCVEHQITRFADAGKVADTLQRALAGTGVDVRLTTSSSAERSG